MHLPPSSPSHPASQRSEYLCCPLPPGALLAIGILNACVQNENDPAFALISDYVSNPDANIRIGAILGLGLAYAGTNREEVEVREGRSGWGTDTYQLNFFEYTSLIIIDLV